MYTTLGACFLRVGGKGRHVSRAASLLALTAICEGSKLQAAVKSQCQTNKVAWKWQGLVFTTLSPSYKIQKELVSFDTLYTYSNKREMWKDTGTRGRRCRMYFTPEASTKASSLEQFTSARGFWAPLPATAIHPSSLL